MLQLHVDPPPITLIKGKHYDKSEKYSDKMKLRLDPTSENLDLYEFKMALFYYGDQEAFLFAHNFKRTLEASGMLQDAAKIQYLCTLVCGEALRHFDILSADFESSNPLTLEAIFWNWVRTFSC